MTRARGLSIASVSVVLLLFAAWATPGTVRRRLATVPEADGAQLQRIGDCDALGEYLIDATTETLVQRWYGGWWRWTGGPSGFDGGATPTDYTTTNNQEDGVDELDIVKSDGAYFYLVEERNLRIIRTWPAERTAVIATVPLRASPLGLLLHGDRIAVVSEDWDEAGSGSVVDLFDVADRAAPTLARTIQVQGSPVGARLIGSDLFLVILSQARLGAGWTLLWEIGRELPALAWDATPEERELVIAQARAILRPHVAKMLEGTNPEDMLPRLVDRNHATGTERRRGLLACSELFRPSMVAELAFLSVAHLRLDDAALASEVRASGVAAGGSTVYASRRSIYVAQSPPWWGWFWMNRSLGEQTLVHRFALGGDDPIAYAATGQVPGYLLDQHAMGEHDGHLRVATTDIAGWRFNGASSERAASNVTVLRDDGQGRLTTVGQVRGIAPGERIFASRFLGPRGFLVTFEQIDPLFTLDLADPTAPRVAGELELPGVSTYLHPLGEDHLLAVGLAGDAQGRLWGMAVNVFDVKDMAKPALAHQHLIDREDDGWFWSDALHDHHAFTFHRGMLAVPGAIYRPAGRSFTGSIVLEVDAEKGVREVGRVDHSDLASGYVWPRRNLYVEDMLYSLSTAGLKVSPLADPARVLAVAPFYPSGR